MLLKELLPDPGGEVEWNRGLAKEGIGEESAEVLEHKFVGGCF